MCSKDHGSVKSYHESPIRSVIQQVVSVRDDQVTVTEPSPVRSSGNNGALERAIKELQNHVLTRKAHSLVELDLTSGDFACPYDPSDDLPMKWSHSDLLEATPRPFALHSRRSCRIWSTCPRSASHHVQSSSLSIMRLNIFVDLMSRRAISMTPRNYG